MGSWIHFLLLAQLTNGAAPSCSEPYFKVSNQASGLATSCAAVDQTADPVVNLDEAGCFAACDALPGCNTVNYRVSDPNFAGNSTCYRKQCADFRVAACSLFTKHKGREVYTKACGARMLWSRSVIKDAQGLFAGLSCPDSQAEVATACAMESGAFAPKTSCSPHFFKVSNEASGLATSCAAVQQTADPVVNLDVAGCFAACADMPGCNTVNYRVSDPNFGGNATCYRKRCGDFRAAACTLFTKHKGRDVYSKADLAPALWKPHVIQDAEGLFAGVDCPSPTAAACAAEAEEPPSAAKSCSVRYFKVSNEASGLATSCGAVEQTADPVVNLDEAGCFAACDALPGCNTVNYRASDPNFGGNATCYRKQCSDFRTAACTLFTKHKGRDVYSKACGARGLWARSVVRDAGGLFAGLACPDEGEAEKACAAEASQPAEAPSCAGRFFKVSNEASGLATSCAAVLQTADPVVDVDEAGCFAACDALPGCNTVNYRVADPNFGGNSTCYRKQCDDFQVAGCTLFTKHKGRGVYTKACGAKTLWKESVVKDNMGLFAGVSCGDAPKEEEETAATSAPQCTRWATTRRDDSSCDVCWEYKADEPVASCQLWEKTPLGSVGNATRCMQMSESASERQEREAGTAYVLQRWQQVGLCNQQYAPGTSDCDVKGSDGETCRVRDQPCHGGVGLPGVAGVLSPGWQMSFDTDLKHVCTMCPTGTYGHCNNACQFRSRFFWSGYYAGQTFASATGPQLFELYEALARAQPEDSDVRPQPLTLTEEVRGFLPAAHPLRTNSLLSSSATAFSIISISEIMVTRRQEVLALARTAGALALAVLLSPSGVKVFLTCECETCPRGKYQDRQGMTQCEDCGTLLPGSSTPDIGGSGPSSCSCLAEEGKFLSHNGSRSRCEDCALVHMGVANTSRGQCPCSLSDTYEVDLPGGLVTCRQCPAHSTTFNPEREGHVPAAERSGAGQAVCQCAPGYSYFGGGANQQGLVLPGRCSPCSEGLQCPGNTSLGLLEEPVVQPGFWADEAFSVFECRALGADACKGGKPRSCHHGRTGLACSACPEGFIGGDKGTCEACAPFDKHRYILATVSWLLLSGALSYCLNKRHQDFEAAETVMASTTVGLLLSFVQATLVLRRLNLKWPRLVADLFSYLTFFFFDPTAFKLDCGGLGGFAGQYCVAAMIPGFACLSFLVWQALSRPIFYLSGGKIPLLTSEETLNSVGTFLQAMFVSVACLVVSFVECMPNPNGMKTLRHYNNVVCGDPEHVNLIPVFLLGVLVYLCGTSALIVWLICVAPNRFMQPRFRKAVYFLVFKFRAEIYWFSFVLLSRSLALSMVSVLVPSHAYLQVIVTLGVIVAFTSVQLVCEPYSSRPCNVLEAIELGSLTAIIGMSMWFLDAERVEQDPQMTDRLSYTIIGLCGICCFSLCATVVQALIVKYCTRRVEDWEKRQVRDLTGQVLAASALLLARDRSCVENLFANTHYVNRRMAGDIAKFTMLELACAKLEKSRSLGALPTQVKADTPVNTVLSSDVTRMMAAHLDVIRSSRSSIRSRSKMSNNSGQNSETTLDFRPSASDFRPLYTGDANTLRLHTPSLGELPSCEDKAMSLGELPQTPSVIEAAGDAAACFPSEIPPETPEPPHSQAVELLIRTDGRVLASM